MEGRREGPEMKKSEAGGATCVDAERSTNDEIRVETESHGGEDGNWPAASTAI